MNDGLHLILAQYSDIHQDAFSGNCLAMQYDWSVYVQGVEEVLLCMCCFVQVDYYMQINNILSRTTTTCMPNTR